MVKNDFIKNKPGFTDFVSAEICLNSLTRDEKEELDSNKTIIEFTPGETIIKRGFTASNILYMEEGLAKLDIITDGYSSSVNLIPPKSFIGIACTFASRNFDFSSIALEKTIVSSYDIGLFEKFISRNGNFAINLIKHMSFVTSLLVHRVSRFVHKNIEGSLSILLLDFCKIYNKDEFSFPINRKEIANMLGYSKESVINTLSKFNKEGIINVHDKKIVILNKEKLLRISEFG